MKLKTEMVDSLSSEQGRKHVSDKHFAADSFHDAAAAHALMQAIENRVQRAEENDHLQEQVTLRGIKRFADELMRAWGFDSGEVAL